MLSNSRPMMTLTIQLQGGRSFCLLAEMGADAKWGRSTYSQAASTPGSTRSATRTHNCFPVRSQATLDLLEQKQGTQRRGALGTHLLQQRPPWSPSLSSFQAHLPQWLSPRFDLCPPVPGAPHSSKCLPLHTLLASLPVPHTCEPQSVCHQLAQAQARAESESQARAQAQAKAGVQCHTGTEVGAEPAPAVAAASA